MTALLLLAARRCRVSTGRRASRAARRSRRPAIKRICVAPEQAEAWRAAGFAVSPLAEAELASREALPTPGITARAGLASPTRSPWIVANGWRFTQTSRREIRLRRAGRKSRARGGGSLRLRRGRGPEDRSRGRCERLGAMLTFLEALPAVDLPPVADLAVVDDGSAITGEVMNLLARRNLLFQVVQAPSPRFPINIAIGSPEYPREEAADPSAFALKIRRQLTDEQRALRVYGSEVVICRLTGDAGRVEAAPDQLRRARDRRAAHPGARSLRRRRGPCRRRRTRRRCRTTSSPTAPPSSRFRGSRPMR